MTGLLSQLFIEQINSVTISFHNLDPLLFSHTDYITTVFFFNLKILQKSYSIRTPHHISPPSSSLVAVLFFLSLNNLYGQVTNHHHPTCNSNITEECVSVITESSADNGELVAELLSR